jgi:hypothetical protein
MPRGKKAGAGSVDEFVRTSVKYLRGKSADSREIILGMIGKELKAGDGESGSGGTVVAPKRKGLTPAQRAKIVAGIKKAKAKKARAAAKEAGAAEGAETAAPSKPKSKAKRKFTKVREGKKKGERETSRALQPAPDDAVAARGSFLIEGPDEIVGGGEEEVVEQ